MKNSHLIDEHFESCEPKASVDVRVPLSELRAGRVVVLRGGRRWMVKTHPRKGGGRHRRLRWCFCDLGDGKLHYWSPIRTIERVGRFVEAATEEDWKRFAEVGYENRAKELKDTAMKRDRGFNRINLIPSNSHD